MECIWLPMDIPCSFIQNLRISVDILCISIDSRLKANGYPSIFNAFHSVIIHGISNCPKGCPNGVRLRPFAPHPQQQQQQQQQPQPQPQPWLAVVPAVVGVAAVAAVPAVAAVAACSYVSASVSVPVSMCMCVCVYVYVCVVPVCLCVCVVFLGYAICNELVVNCVRMCLTKEHVMYVRMYSVGCGLREGLR